MVGEAWVSEGRDGQSLGDIEIGDLEANRAGYVAGYVENKLAKKGDVHLVDRETEFARMSLRPGIGSGVVQQIASVLVSHGLHESELDVPTVLRHGKKQMPLGRYLRRRLRLMIGRDEKAPEEVLQALQDEMQELRQAVEAATSDHVGRRYRKEYLKNAIIDANMGIKWKLEGDRSRRQKGSI